jgi:hypothetical protein
LKAIVHDEFEVQDCLSDLGIPLQVLIDAALAGEYLRNTATKNDPVSAGGTFAWTRTVRSLREQLQPLGWKPMNPGNLPLVVNETTKIAICVSIGTEGTGRPVPNPATKYPVGPQWQKRVRQNQQNVQEELFDLEESDADEDAAAFAAQDYTTWVLLRRRDGDELHLELSLPDRTDQGQVEHWARRILLPTIKLNEPPTPREGSSEIRIDVPIVRRNS